MFFRGFSLYFECFFDVIFFLKLQFPRYISRAPGLTHVHSLTFDVAHAVAVAVLERPRVDLIEYGRLPPVQAVRNAVLGRVVSAICRGRVTAIVIDQVQQKQEHAVKQEARRERVKIVTMSDVRVARSV